MAKKKGAGEGIISKAKKLIPGRKEPEKNPRGHYKQKECPYCQKHVGNLGNHIKLKHPTESPPVELTKEDLVSPKKKPSSEDITYTCNSCRAELRKNENPCWNCGNILNWEGLSG